MTMFEPVPHSSPILETHLGMALLQAGETEGVNALRAAWMSLSSADKAVVLTHLVHSLQEQGYALCRDD
jgi:hypothetical protein